MYIVGWMTKLRDFLKKRYESEGAPVMVGLYVRIEEEERDRLREAARSSRESVTRRIRRLCIPGLGLEDRGGKCGERCRRCKRLMPGGGSLKGCRECRGRVV